MDDNRLKNREQPCRRTAGSSGHATQELAEDGPERCHVVFSVRDPGERLRSPLP